VRDLQDLRDWYTDNDWRSVVKHVLLFTLTLVACTGVAFLISDCAGGSTLTSPGTITGRHYVPPRTEMVCDSRDEDGTCQRWVPRYHPEEYHLHFTYDQGRHYAQQQVRARVYDTPNGASVTVRYRKGLWTDNCYFACIVSGL
jgi:hypothetical protein